MKKRDRCADGCPRGCEHDLNTKKFPQAAHTPEPWEVGAHQKGRIMRTAILSADSHYITTEVCGHDHQGSQQANAARIVSCVNALAGVEDPGAAVRELVEAAKEALSILNMDDEIPVEYTEPSSAHSDDWNAAIMLRAALAKFPAVKEAAR